jgi:dTDP-4-dehydrorhamnose reductase
MKILITGVLGRLGGKLAALLSADHEVTGYDLPELDIVDFNATRAKVSAAQPDVILHPAAWTDVDGCAREPGRAVLINGLGAQNVALAAAEIGAAILYVSSNEVFDGRQSRPYLEYDRCAPANSYGYSKWVGEQAVAQVNPRHYIVRTSWLFAHGGRNFIQAILGAAQAGKPLRIVTDEVANPTYNDDLAHAIVALIHTNRYGTYHLVNEGSVSRYEFARYVLDNAGYANTPAERISIKEWSRPSTPPTYAGLTNLAAASIGIKLRPWQDAVTAFLQQENSTR